MPTPAGALARLAVKAWPLLREHWPKVLVAVQAVIKYVQDNPALPDWLRKRYADLVQRIIAVQLRPGDAAKIRGTLDIVRDVARDAQTADPGAIDAAVWIRKADDIGLGVRLAEELSREARRPALARLRSRTDDLLADLIDTVAHLGAEPRTGDEPPAQ